MPFKPTEIIAVDVYLESRKSRRLVGKLTREKGIFTFTYDDQYLKAVNAIPLGPEMPLTRKIYQSKDLFVAFVDRLPSKENPAYEEYCRATGISADEDDPFVLLTPIGQRGPSWLIFTPRYSDDFFAEELKNFREFLDMSVREFASCFEFSPAAITRVELEQSSGAEVLKRVEIYAKYPQVAIDQILRRGNILHRDKRKTILERLRISQPSK